MSVIYGFSAIVDKLDDSELLVPILHKLGETHAPRNVTDQAYWVKTIQKLQFHFTI